MISRRHVRLVELYNIGVALGLGENFDLPSPAKQGALLFSYHLYGDQQPIGAALRFKDARILAVAYLLDNTVRFRKVGRKF